MNVSRDLSGVGWVVGGLARGGGFKVEGLGGRGGLEGMVNKYR